MASNLSSSVYQTSDLIHDFACSPCEDDGLNNEAQFFCDQCRKYYCNNCVAHHNKLFRTHSVLGKQAVSKWVGYAGLSPIEICDKHGDKKLDMLCEDHDELGCYVCVSLTHRMCQSIKHIPDIAGKVKSTTEFKQFPSNVRLTSSKLQSLSDKTLQNKQSLKDAGKKILAEIKSLRKEINNTFDELETKTNTILQNQLHDADEFLQEDIDKCTQLHEKLRTFLEAIQSQQDDTSYIAYRKCKDKMREAESLIQELSVKPDTILTFHSDPRIEQFLYGLKTLGGTLAFPCKHSWKYIPTSHVFNVKNRSKSIVKMQSDVHECFIGGICELPGGEILITDMKKYKVKLLNSQYQVTATCDFPVNPNHICHIAGNEAAVTLGYEGVHFITFTGSTLTVTRKLSFQHLCLGISHHNGNLYVGSLTAIYHYTMSGQFIGKIYEDKSSFYTINRFTVSRDGTTIFIPTSECKKLATIDTSGNILSTLQDPDIDWPISVCVSDSGHVFVCSQSSSKVTQIDKEGKHSLATLAIQADGLKNPDVIWFTRQTHRLIVGGEGNELSVFELE